MLVEHGGIVLSKSQQRKSSSQLDRRRTSALAKDNAAYAAKREEIIDAAAMLFEKEGYDATSLADIARAMGADRASIYYYISNKEELLREICSSSLDSNLAAAKDIAAREVSAVEKVRLVIAQHMSANATIPRWSVLVQEARRLAEADAEWAREEFDRMRQYDSILAGIIQEGIDDGSIRADVPPRLAVNAIFGMLNSTSRWWNPEGRYDASAVSNAFAVIALEGLAH